MRQIKRVVGLMALSLLVLGQSGCALALLPGLGAIGGAGYLWGKDAGHDEAKDAAASPDVDAKAK